MSSLKNCLDPFHDTDVAISQFPDGNTRPSIVQEVRSSVSFSVPSGSDLICNLMPFMIGPNALSAPMTGTRAGLQYSEAVSGGGQVSCSAEGVVAGLFTTPTPGFLDLFTVASGNLYYPNGVNAWTSDAAAARTRIAVPNMASVSSGSRRLLSVGLELHNTTADLYKQGTITCYRKQQSYSQARYLAGTPNAISTAPGAVKFGTSFGAGSSVTPLGFPPTMHSAYLPPASVGAAMALPGSRQWEAKEGAYLVGTLADPMNQAMRPNEQGFPMLIAYDVDVAEPLGAVTAPNDCIIYPNLFPSTYSAVVAPAYLTGKQAAVDFIQTGFNNTGFIATGLGANSTFTLTIKAIWEFAPSVVENVGQSLVWLAKAPPRYDPAFLELYQDAARSLPVAVMVKENPAGEWYNTVTGLLKSAVVNAGSLAPVLTKIPDVGPALAATSLGMSAIGTAAWGDKKPRPATAPARASNARGRTRSNSAASRSTRTSKSSVKSVSFGNRKTPKRKVKRHGR